MVLLAMVPPKGQVAFERNEPITVSPTNVADLSGQRTEGHYFQPMWFWVVVVRTQCRIRLLRPLTTRIANGW